jgi:hypothetical protein
MTAAAQLNPVYLDPHVVAKAIGGKAKGNKIMAHAPGHTKGSPELEILIDPHAPRGLLLRCYSGEDPVAMKDWVLRQCGEPDFAPTQKAAAPTAHVALPKPKAPLKRFSDGHLTRQGYAVAAVYDYATPDGEILFQVVRYEGEGLDKTFLQRRPDGRSGWLSGRGEPILYCWPELASRPSEPVYIVEGEKDADRLIAAGLLATTVPNGSWPDDLSPLKGRKVYVLPDNDEPGEKKVATAMEKLQGVATVRRVELPHLPPKGDVSDWLDAGNTIEQLQALAKASAPAPANDNRPTGPELIHSGDFVRGFVPPDYAVDGIMQSGFLYSLTGQTGSGKTAVALLLALCTALGSPFAGRETKGGRVFYFAGENPDDVTMRWIGLLHDQGLDADDLDVHFIRGVFSVSEFLGHIAERARDLGGVDLIIVDTTAAYFTGSDENSNVEMGNYARQLRELAKMEWRPAVLAASHPVKNAGADNLLPRGGGAFLNEVDGNLTLAKRGEMSVLHWQGKHRGPDFLPLTFDLKTINAPALVDSKGRPIPTVMAAPVGDEEVAMRADSDNGDDKVMLLAIRQNGNRSLRDLAEFHGWTNAKGEPDKKRAQNSTDRLKRSQYVVYELQQWKLTRKGEEAASAAAADIHEKRKWSGVAHSMVEKAEKRHRTGAARTVGK